MTFPVVFHIFGYPLPAHGVLELVAYTTGFQLYLQLRKISGCSGMRSFDMLDGDSNLVEKRSAGM